MRKIVFGTAFLLAAMASAASHAPEAQARGAGVRGVVSGPGSGAGPVRGPGRVGLVDSVRRGPGGWSGGDWRPGGTGWQGRGIPVGGGRVGRGDGYGRGGWNGRGGWDGRGRRGEDGGRGEWGRDDWSWNGDRDGRHRRDRPGRDRRDRGGHVYADGIGIGDGGWAAEGERLAQDGGPTRSEARKTWRNPCRSYWYDGFSWRC
ncbi:hypothetical protein [Sphingosinicella sp. BN140058]|uniref:hypothetical protein n=1 Tax=Sphingosinicella sp. BN140058 TaxID=1892855 RepID=UPI001012450B|nr:hypothetical protein [Sphingosinicella sp. BN140058]QAY77801.1 hypothetical protein ETR14_15715 [Sphingosinicella sp. BN140058]